MHSAAMRYALIPVVVALASCTTTPPVDRLGQDTYRITIVTPMAQNRPPAEMALSDRRIEEASREATRRSHAYCARQRRQAVEVESALSVQSIGDSEEPIDLATAEWVGIRTLTFRCAPIGGDSAPAPQPR